MVRHEGDGLKGMYQMLERRPPFLVGDQRGITGLETAIVLIAFVVVASVFAFAVLSTGLVSSEKSKASVLGALEETSATLSVRGGVVGTSNAALTGITSIKFNLASASQSYESVELSTANTIVTYLDQDQALNVAATDWSVTWLIGSGAVLDPGEQVELVVSIAGLSPLLGTSKEFSIQVKPNRGAVVAIERTTPAELKPTVNLQ